MMLPLREPPGFAVEAAADAMAQQDMFAIGGYLKLTTGRVCWFSESFKLCDLNFTGLELLDTAQSYIASCAALAQIAWLHCTAALFPGGRFRVRIKSKPLMHRQMPVEHFCAMRGTFLESTMWTPTCFPDGTARRLCFQTFASL